MIDGGAEPVDRFRGIREDAPCDEMGNRITQCRLDLNGRPERHGARVAMH
jgi:hypothetical protein